MQIKYDSDADAIYIKLRDVAYAYGKDLDRERRIDYGTDNAPIGVELLDVSAGVDVRNLPDERAIGRLLEEHAFKVFA